MAKIDFLGGLDSFRLRRLVQEAINHFELDLTGARVLTEAGSGIYAATPILAAAAGAKVHALTRDSAYGTVPEVRHQVTTLAEVLDVGMDNIQIATDRASVPHDLDIITNLGFVRPVDAALVELLATSGTVSYMCEAWEFRDGDVDLAACDKLRVPVAGLWEDFEGLNIFRSCGQLAVKLCFEAGLEVAGNRIILISTDKFGAVIASALEANLAAVRTLSSVADLTESLVAGAEAIIVADYAAEATILGGIGGPAVRELAQWNPALLVLQFVGPNDTAGLRDAGIRVFPDRQLEPHRMAFTLAYLGLRPAIFLHVAGLKVGELLWRARTDGSITPRFRALVQPMNEPAIALDVGNAV
jgi:hypothetical protein